MPDTDINKLIAAAQKGADPLKATRAGELASWTKAAAKTAAREEGLELTDAHYKVLQHLQTLYVEHGPAPHARLVASALAEAFAKDGGSRYLYQLFPGGPVAQGSRIAGVPAPHDTQDRSFGSTF